MKRKNLPGINKINPMINDSMNRLTIGQMIEVSFNLRKIRPPKITWFGSRKSSKIKISANWTDCRSPKWAEDVLEHCYYSLFITQRLKVYQCSNWDHLGLITPKFFMNRKRVQLAWWWWFGWWLYSDGAMEFEFWVVYKSASGLEVFILRRIESHEYCKFRTGNGRKWASGYLTPS